MSKIETVTVKTDFLTEVSKTLLKGREVAIAPAPSFGGKMNISLTVVKRSGDRFRPDAYYRHAISAEDIYRHEVDGAYVNALARANFELDRFLGES